MRLKVVSLLPGILLALGLSMPSASVYASASTCEKLFQTSVKNEKETQKNEKTVKENSRKPLPTDLEPYRAILENGIRTKEDLELADKLFRLVEPNDGGVLAERSASIPHIIKPGRATNNGITFGITYNKEMARETAIDAEKIELYTYELRDGTFYGADIMTVKHERVHGVEYKHLPARYQVKYPKPNSEASLLEVYKTVLTGRHYDETAAFLSSVLLAKSFKDKFGIDILEFPAFNLTRSTHNTTIEQYKSGGILGILKGIRNNEAYLSYKIAALYYALQLKTGFKGTLNWKDILDNLGVEEIGPGQLSVNAEKIMEFYKTTLEPLINKNGLGLISIYMKLSSKERVLLETAGKFFLGQLSKEESTAFLKNDFESIILIIEKLDSTFSSVQKRTEADESSASLLDKVSETISNVVETVSSATDIATRQIFEAPVPDKNKVTADSIEVLGRFPIMVAKSEKISENPVRTNFDGLLNIAETSRVEASDPVYIKLIEAHNQDAIWRTQSFDLGISLIQNGRSAEGVKIIREAIRRSYGEKRVEEDYYISTGQLSKLVELNHHVLIFEFLKHEFRLHSPGIKTFKVDDVSMYPEGHVSISKAISVLSTVLSAYENSSLMPSKTKKLIEHWADTAWLPFMEWTRNKIKNFHQTYASDLVAFKTIDELTAHNPQNGGSNSYNDLARLVGFPSDNYQSMGVSWFAFKFVKSRHMYTVGRKFLSEHPDGFHKVILYEKLAETMLKYAPKSDLKEFFEEYDNAFEVAKKGFAQWRFFENSESMFQPSFSTRKKSVTPEEVDEAYHTHLYWRMLAYRAEAELIDTSLGKETIEKLMSLENNQNYYFTRNDFEFSGMKNALSSKAFYSNIKNQSHFSAEIYKAVWMVENYQILSLKFSSATILNRAASLISGAGPSRAPLQHPLQIFIVEKLLNLAVKEADPQLYSNIRKKVEHVLVNVVSTSSKLFFFDLDSVKTQIEFYDAIMAGGNNIQQLKIRFAQDVKNSKEQFSLSGIIEGLELISHPKIYAYLNRPHALLHEMAYLAVDKQIREMGLSNLENSLTNVIATIRKLPLTEAEFDNLFYYFIERITPEKGVAYSENDRSMLKGVVSIFDQVKFIVKERKIYPKAYAILMDRTTILAAITKQMDPADYKTKYVTDLLGWYYKNGYEAELANVENQAVHSQLRNSKEYKETLAALVRPNVTVNRNADDSTLKINYANALKDGDIQKLSSLREQITEEFEAEAAKLNLELKKGRQIWQGMPRRVLLAKELDASWADRLFKDWKTTHSRGDKKLSDKLFELLMYSKDSESVSNKAYYFIEILKAGKLSHLQMRRVFFELSKTRFISSYAKSKWKELIKQPDRELEKYFYRLVSPTFNGFDFSVRNNLIVSYALDLPVGERAKLISTIESHDKYLLSEPLTRGYWKIDPTDKHSIFYDLVITAVEASPYSFENNMKVLMEVMSVDKIEKIRTDILDMQDRSDRKSYNPNFITHRIAQRYYPLYFQMRPSDYKELEWRMKSFTRTPTAKERVDILTELQDWQSKIEIARDKVRLQGFKLPQVFSDQSPLVHFIISRFFVRLSAEKQQELIREMKNVPRGEALKTFFEKTHLEKVGQFLSFWPEVPADVRAQLAKLQDNNERSDINEVKDLIGMQNAPGMREILTNLNENPLGVGSIGEAYKSTLGGKPVVVKVITPSKEKNFRKSMESTREISDILIHYGDKIRGGKRAAQFIEMFLEMVELEFQLAVEARHAMEFKRLYGKELDVPQYYDGLVFDKVAVQEFVDGYKIQSLPANVRVKVLDGIRTHFMGSQIASRGFYHSDIQPGNIIVGKNGRTYLIDYGQMGILTKAEIKTIFNFIMATKSQNFFELAKIIRIMSSNAASITQAQVNTLASQLSGLKISINNENQLSESISTIIEVASNNGFLISNSYLHLVKGLATLEGTIHSYGQ